MPLETIVMPLETIVHEHMFKCPMLMLDIETVGTVHESTVYEVGVLHFKGFPSFEVIDEHSWMLNCKDQEDRVKDPSTLRWMATQGITYRYEKAQREGVSVHVMYHELKSLLTEKPALWAQGPQFDHAILESLFQGKKLDIPWRHHTPMDLRTLSRFTEMFGGPYEKGEVPHDALGDCRLQLKRLKHCFKFFGDTADALAHGP